MEKIGTVTDRVLSIKEHNQQKTESILTSVQAYLQKGNFEKAREATLQLDRKHRNPAIEMLKEHLPKTEKCERCDSDLKWYFVDWSFRWQKSKCIKCEYDGIKVEVRNNCQAIMANRGIPKRYLGASLDDFPKSYEQWSKTDSGLFLCGPRGTGKTHLMAAMMRMEILTTNPRKCWKTDLDVRREGYAEPLYSDYPLLISVPEFLLKLRGAFKNFSVTTEEEILSEYSNVKVLYLDDLGTEKPTDWSLQTLYLLIDRRYREMLKTSISSNLSLDELADRLDDRISSRIAGMCKVIHMNGNDRRVSDK